MNLVLYDRQWGPLAAAFEARLSADWRMAVGWDDLEWLLRELPGADAMIGRAFPREALPYADELRLFLFPGAGHPFERDSELPDGCALSVVFEHEIAIAEYVLMTALMHCTGVRGAITAFAESHWQGSGLMAGVPHTELCGKTVGLIGCGHIGDAVAQRAAALGLRVLGARRDMSRPWRWGVLTALDTLLSGADAVVVACPLNQNTRGLLGRRELS